MSDSDTRKEKMTGDMLPEYWDEHIPASKLELSETNGRNKLPPEDKKRVFNSEGLVQGIIHPPFVWYNEDADDWRVEDGWQRTQLVKAEYKSVPCRICESWEKARAMTQATETSEPQTRFTRVNRFGKSVKRRMEQSDCTETEAIEEEVDYDVSSPQIKNYVRAAELPYIVKELLKEGGKSPDDPYDIRDDAVNSLNNYIIGEDKDFTDNDYGLSVGKARDLSVKTNRIMDDERREKRIKEIAGVIGTVGSRRDCASIIDEAVANLDKGVPSIREEVCSPSVSREGLVLEGSTSFNDLDDRDISAIENWIQTEDKFKLQDFVMKAVEEKSQRHRADMNGEYNMGGILSGDVYDEFVKYAQDKQTSPEHAEKLLIESGLESEGYPLHPQPDTPGKQMMFGQERASVEDFCSPIGVYNDENLSVAELSESEETESSLIDLSQSDAEIAENGGEDFTTVEEWAKKNGGKKGVSTEDKTSGIVF